MKLAKINALQHLSNATKEQKLQTHTVANLQVLFYLIIASAIIQLFYKHSITFKAVF